jgi:hypothetical protein
MTEKRSIATQSPGREGRMRVLSGDAALTSILSQRERKWELSDEPRNA